MNFALTSAIYYYLKRLYDSFVARNNVLDLSRFYLHNR